MASSSPSPYLSVHAQHDAVHTAAATALLRGVAKSQGLDAAALLGVQAAPVGKGGGKKKGGSGDDKAKESTTPAAATGPTGVELLAKAMERPSDPIQLTSYAFKLTSVHLTRFAAVKALLPKGTAMGEFCKRVAAESIDAANAALAEAHAAGTNAYVERVGVSDVYFEFFVRIELLAGDVRAIRSGEFFARAPLAERVMIEYSQPNTHKTFHVGHMRNAALGHSLVQLFKFAGHHVDAVNYIGDVGAHIARCLWYYMYHYDKKNTDAQARIDAEIEAERAREPASPLAAGGAAVAAAGGAAQSSASSVITEIDWCSFIDADVPAGMQRVHWLGAHYSTASEALNFGSWTTLPYFDYVLARVAARRPHAQNEKWQLVDVVTAPAGVGTERKTFQVVCGGKGFDVGDVVVYAPLGSRKGGKLVVEMDMKGEKSIGCILSEKEVGASENNEQIYRHRFASDAEQADDARVLGLEACEAGRKASCPLPATRSLSLEMRARNRQVKTVLRLLEEEQDAHDAALKAAGGDASKLDASAFKLYRLWSLTREWSLEDFRDIYAWIDVHFDHYFHESDVGEESRRMVIDAFDGGKNGLVKSDGAIGVDLKKHKLGFAMLLTSAGTGLYLTKDLALAKRKFEDWKVDRSVYVVDATQTLHFQQAFKVLEVAFNFEQAKKCFHLAYGMVTIPEGKMSSRKGTVVFFSQLKEALSTMIHDNFIKAKPWPDAEKTEATRALAVAAIKYGMLKQDSKMDIVFDMKQWTAKDGNTGPYLMYAYVRTRAVLRELGVNETIGTTADAAAADADADKKADDDKKKEAIVPVTAAELDAADLSLLSHDLERKMMQLLTTFPGIVDSAVAQYAPVRLCSFAYGLARQISRWYEACSIKNAGERKLLIARLALCDAAGRVLRQALNLLGIKTIERM